MPAPSRQFRRPRLEAGQPAAERRWKYVEAGRLTPGDTVAQRGQVLLLDYETDRPNVIVVTGIGQRHERSEHPEVLTYAFSSTPTCGAQNPKEARGYSAGLNDVCALEPDHSTKHRAVNGSWE